MKALRALKIESAIIASGQTSLAQGWQGKPCDRCPAGCIAPAAAPIRAAHALPGALVLPPETVAQRLRRPLFLKKAAICQKQWIVCHTIA
ncbi:MAG: hypothetical protein RSC66_01165, partial [Comamonas sp.]